MCSYVCVWWGGYKDCVMKRLPVSYSCGIGVNFPDAFALHQTGGE
jgi:hypothetical protein